MSPQIAYTLCDLFHRYKHTDGYHQNISELHRTGEVEDASRYLWPSTFLNADELV